MIEGYRTTTGASSYPKYALVMTYGPAELIYAALGYYVRNHTVDELDAKHGQGSAMMNADTARAILEALGIREV